MKNKTIRFFSAIFTLLLSAQMIQAQVPVINSVSPSSGPVGTTVTILGENFSPLGSNIVYFGAVRATVVSGTTNILEATVPVGATHAPITVTVDGLVAYANAAFQPTFSGNGQPISASTFAARQDKAAGGGAFLTVNADLDGNGKPDLAVANLTAHSVSLFRNVGTNGPLVATSFTRVDFPPISTAEGPYGLAGGDVDGDGKTDLVFADSGNNRVGVYRNISVVGILSTNSFAAPVYFPVGVTPKFVRVRDLDGDGKSEIVTANAGGTVSILQNIGVSGSLNTNSFATAVNLTSGIEAYDVAIQDLDGDGKPDLSIAHMNTAFISLFRNISTPGAITTNSFAPRVDLPSVANNWTVIAGDVDGDGKPDLLVGGKGSILSVYRNLASPGSLTTNSFAAPVNFGNPGWVHTIALGDINGDGKPDISTVGELNDYMAVYQNQSTPGSFTAASLATRVDFSTGWNAFGISVGDLDGDERPDVVFANVYHNSLSFYRNISPFGGPPAITSQPTNRTVAAGANVTFNVVATGSQPLTYQWSLNGTNIGNATTSSLTLTNVQPANAGNYSVLITNSLGSATSSNALLTVLFPPNITLQPQSQNVLPGSNATFSVTATGTSLGYQWRFNGGKITNATASSYVVTNAQSTNVGGYSVVITNAVGSVTSVVANLTIDSPPTVLSQPQSQNVVVGTNVTFSVSATGGFPLSYQWKFNGTNIAGLTSSSITLTNVQQAANGNYSVVVTNSAGITSSSNAVLTVLLPVIITSQPQSQNVLAGSNATFSVTATGGGPLGYQWKFQQVNIAGATGSAYAINNAQPTNAGNYSVVVSNPVSFASSSNAVLSIAFPPVITSQPQGGSVIAGTNVTFSVVVVGAEPILPAIGSGTIKLWLKADAGVISNALGFVSEWRDQSSNANHAAQGNTNQQPRLIQAPEIGGRLTLRFDGIQDPAVGDYLRGTNNVGIPDGFTSFIVYSRSNRSILEQAVTIVGIPGSDDSVRAFAIYGTEMGFSGWGNDYGSGFNIPATTYRVLTQRLNTNKTLIEYFDTNGATNFTATRATGGLQPPGNGYYVGGLGAETRNFAGDISELIYYQGALNNPDRIAVETYLKQKYYQGVSSGFLSFQWQFDGTNIVGATNSSLTLSNVQLSAAGNYSVVVTNLAGSTTSSNAVLAVLTPPLLTTQPQDQNVLSGSNAIFSVTATGSSLNYQWRFNGITISNATSSSYSIASAQPTNAGGYSVVITNAVGAITSIVANLTVIGPPIIVAQPQSQTVLAGSNVTFSVGLGGSGSSLPSISSGMMRLWLKADTGVITNGAGLVSQWQDQSGNANHASQSNTNLQPVLVHASGIGGRPVLRFDGIQSAGAGDFLKGTGDVGIPDGYTSFLVYLAKSTANVENIPVWVDRNGGAGAARAYYIYNQRMAFATWLYDSHTGFIIPTNTYRIWTHRLNTNRTLIEFFDSTATTSTNINVGTSNLIPPLPGYTVGGIDPQLTEGRNFGGDIAELIYFRGTLSEPDRLAVENYLKQKYYQIGSFSSATYQWLFNGTNIVGATNASLTLSNVQPSAAGNYSVFITNLAGSTLSSNAVLTVVIPPSIVTQPQTQSINAGSTATFNVVATGTAPLSYQWQKNLGNLSGATNSSFVINSVQPSDAGNYRVIVSSPYGTVISSNAVLTVNVSTVRVVSVATTSAADFVLPIELVALGNENALGFSLSFNSAILTYTGASLGSGAGGATLIANTNQLGSGRVGLALARSANTTFAAGTQQVVQVSFKVAPVTNGLGTSVSFADQPTVRQVSDVGANTLWSSFIGGIVTVTAVDFEADVSPRPTGNRALTITDWVQVGRFAAGLDTVANANELQRADCAPRNNLGNGTVTITDWVQAGRYAAGVDPLTPVGGPSESSLAKQSAPTTGDANRIINLEATSQEGQTNVVSVRLIAQGDENAMGFSLSFDPAILTFVGATVGGNAVGALLNVNKKDLAEGKVGAALALVTGENFPAGTQEAIKLTFVAAPDATGSTTLTFTDTPIFREVSDADANSLPANFSNGNLAITIPGPLLTITQTVGGVSLSWPASATNFVLESSSTLETNWTSVTSDLTTNAQSISTILPSPGQQLFFRLKK